MRNIFRFLAILLILVVLFTGCNSSIVANRQEEAEVTTEDNWKERFENWPVEERIEIMRQHLKENEAILEEIAHAMIEESKKYPDYRVVAQDGKMYLLDNDGYVRESESYSSRNMKSHASELVENYLRNEGIAIQSIGTDFSRARIDTDVCLFGQGSYLDNDDLSEVELVYCMEPGISGKYDNRLCQFIPIDEHWQILVTHSIH